MREEGNEDSHPARSVLVYGRHNQCLLPHSAEHFHAGRGFADHVVAAAFSFLHDQIVNKSITQTTMNNMDGKPITGMGVGKQLPVAEVTSQNQCASVLASRE